MWTHTHPIFIITSFASWSHPWNYFAKFGVYVFIMIVISMTQRIDMCITLLLSNDISTCMSQTAVDRMWWRQGMDMFSALLALCESPHKV